METETLDSPVNSKPKQTEDGLPIFNNKSVTEEGLPIFKKKVSTSVSPSTLPSLPAGSELIPNSPANTDLTPVLPQYRDAVRQQSMPNGSGPSPSGMMPVKLVKPARTPIQQFTQTNGTVRKDKSWENLGDFVPKTVMGGLDKDAGQALEFLGRNLPKGTQPLLNKEQGNKLAQIGLKLEGWGQEHLDQAQQHQLPNTAGGNVTSTAVGFAPTMLELALTPELDVAKLGKLGDVLAKYGGKYALKAATVLGGKFPVLMGTKGLTSGYDEAKANGASDYDAMKDALVKSGEEYGKGVLFEGAGKAASKVSDIGKKLLEDKGWMAGGKILSTAQKAILNSSAQATAFSAVPFITNAVQGKSTSMQEIKDNAIFGGVLGLFHGDEPGKDSDKPSAAEGSAKEIQERSPLIDMHHFMSADMDAIKYAHSLKENPVDLQMKAATHAQDAFENEDPETKQQQAVQSSINGKLSSVKSVTNAILKNKEAVIDAVPDIPEKQQIIDKINAVHKELDPTEQAKTALGNQISDIDNQLAAIPKEEADPVRSAENEVKTETLTKQREELNNQLKQTILKQQENESTNEDEKRKADEEKSNEGGDESEKSSQNGEKNDVTPTGGGEASPVTNQQDNAIQEQSTGKVDVQSKASDGEKVGEGDTKSEKSAKQSEESSKNEKPRYKIKGDVITRLPIAEHSELNTILKQEDGIDISHLKDVHEQERNAGGEQDTKTATDAEAVQQPENDGAGNAGENRPGESAETAKGAAGKATFKKATGIRNEDVELTGIKKIISEATRVQKDLPDVKLSKLGKDSETLELGKKLVGTGDVKPSEVIDRVISGKGIYTPNEASGIQYYMHQLRSEETNLRNQLTEVNNFISENPNHEDFKEHLQAKAMLLGNLRQLDDRIDNATEANRINSRSWGNLGNIMQIEADQSFNPSNIRAVIRDNYNGEIPKDVEEKLTKAIDERDKALFELKKANEKFTDKQGEKVVNRIRKSVSLIKQSKAELLAEEVDLKKELIKAFKQDISRINSGIPLPTETLAVLGKLAVNYFKQGIKDFEGLANKIYDELKEQIPNLEKDDIKSYLSSYEPLREASKQRDVELLGRKERSAIKQVETGKIIDRSAKQKIVYPKDNDIIKAEQKVINAEFKLKQEKAKSYKFSTTKTQRGLDFVTRWERRFVLSSPAILSKLTSAVTIGSGLKRIPEEILIGTLWSKAFKAIADKAPIEGGFNAKAEAEYWKEFSNPKKFLHNAKEIFKTGASDLTKEFSTKLHEHYQYYDALTDLHPIIKDISKRATYEASLIKGYNWAQNNGLDISDPLIRQNIKQQAYNRAEYEIFQEDSQWGKRLQNFLRDNREPKSTKDMLIKFGTKFMLPVNLVPLNIVRRVGNYVTGLPRGLYNAREAYKNGIENLSNEQAEVIMKQLKQGSMGAALFSMGLFKVGGSFGGLYNKDDRDRLNMQGEKNPGFDEMYLNNVNIPRPVQHALPLQIIQLGATYRNILKLYINQYPYKEKSLQGLLDKYLNSNAQALFGSVGAEAEQIPMVETPFEMYGSLSDPYQRKKLGKDMLRRVTPTIVTDALKYVKKK